MTSRDERQLPLAELAARLRRGAVSAESYLCDRLELCDAHSELNIFISLDREQALAAARSADRAVGSGMLHGVPVVVKGNLDVRGLPTTNGLPIAASPATRDSGIVGRLRSAGAIILGTTNMHPRAMGWTGENPTYGPARNPRDSSRIAGGSSGGSASAVAAGIVPAAVTPTARSGSRQPSAGSPG